ncbi:N-acetylmuramoyl-L-alanine amidase [Pseudanabaena mucicola]|uniref:N-acetylmuramoyl-L-alanine amidase n=1 Tax=Pseudanabaena mucicola FACHB-723 TaxID=2692860 RepID=A0ABR7ZZU6_9CYAN|nr:N-acetylmuramoyl-L-alanine amidase [Pseudanabaena mucicola]MBD2188821.1 N-acetylmuramoyl-L-alanine amidase [Pseudanabaena mucicola FACHB-723]
MNTHRRTILRYRQLAVGVVLTVASGYAMPILAQVKPNTTIASSLSNTLRLNSIRPVGNGLMLNVNANPQISIQREDNPDRLIIDLQNTSLQQELHKATVPMNRLGIKQIRVAQFQNSPAVTRLVFDLDSADPNSKNAWRSQYIAATNTLLLTPTSSQPQATSIPSSLPTPSVTLPSRPIVSTTGAPAAIERLSFSSTGQLLVEANKPVNYQTRLDTTSGTYSLTIPNASISPNLQRPSLAANSPIERIRLSQVGSAVEIGIQPIAGWQVRELQRRSNQQIQLQVSLNSSPSRNNPVPLPANTTVTQSPQNIGDRRRGVVVVDAGHGGRDPGAIGNGIQEKDVVLAMSMNVGRALQAMGYTVFYTRTNDVEIDLEPRVAFARRNNADVFVSVHANSLDSRNSSVNGVETFHARGSTTGKELASYVQSQIIGATRANNRGVKAAGFYVLTKTSMPAILVETGFVTNPTEARNLNSPEYQRQMADAIAKGVDQFFRVRGR